MLAVADRQMVIGLQLDLALSVHGVMLLGLELAVAVRLHGVVAFVADADLLVLSDRFISRAMRCMRSPLRSSQSKNTATGLPCSGSLAKASITTYLCMGSPGSGPPLDQRVAQQVGDDARTLAGQHRFGVELHGGEARPAQGKYGGMRMGVVLVSGW